jgi:formyltetrahydrofolate deformylase
MRIEWGLKDFAIENEKITNKFLPVAREFNITYSLKFSSRTQNIAIFVSKEDHCLVDLILKKRAGELKCEIPLIISNHPEVESIVKALSVNGVNCGNNNYDYYVVRKNKENKISQEKKELKLLKKYDIDLIVLAKYMQILSKDFVSSYKNKIINVHHSFLPAFKGAKPYLQAYTNGVKLIGATAHYVTEELDCGPIIEQEVTRISHKDSLEDIINKGKDMEKLVFFHALKWHLENKILVYKNKTIVFD